MNPKEQRILKSIRRGDIHSFETLFHQFFPGLERYAISLLHKESVAEEVVQDVFYNIWKNREVLHITRSWQSYLYRAVYNNSLMYLRKTRREYFTEKGQVPDSAEPFDDRPDVLLEEKELQEAILETLACLPERTRTIFEMNRDEGLKYREIADRLSISVKTVEAHMGRSLKALRTTLQKHGVDTLHKEER
ncbi:MAG: RNA polymerase sigma-70 factor [Bacteroidales bacterium]